MKHLVLMALLSAAVSASAQGAPERRVEPFAGFGFGAAFDPEVGWFAVQVAAGARAGVPTAQIRATGMGQILDASERWDVAALGGATFSGPVGALHVGAGPSLAGGLDKSSCFLAWSCSPDRGRTLRVRLGIGIAADAFLRIRGESFVGVQGFANVTGPRTTRGLSLGVRRGF